LTGLGQNSRGVVDSKRKERQVYNGASIRLEKVNGFNQAPTFRAKGGKVANALVWGRSMGTDLVAVVITSTKKPNNHTKKKKQRNKPTPATTLLKIKTQLKKKKKKLSITKGGGRSVLEAQTDVGFSISDFAPTLA